MVLGSPGKVVRELTDDDVARFTRGGRSLRQELAALRGRTSPGRQLALAPAPSKKEPDTGSVRLQSGPGRGMERQGSGPREALSRRRLLAVAGSGDRRRSTVL